MIPPDNAAIVAAFAAMRIVHPRVTMAHEVFSTLRKAGRLSRGHQQKFCCIFAPTYSGKSIAAKMYIENVVGDELIAEGVYPADKPRMEIAQEQKRVLYVSLSASAASAKTLAIDILTVIGGPIPRGAGARELLRRVYAYLEHFGVELLIIDELHHLARTVRERSDGKVSRDGPVLNTTIPNTWKAMLNEGVVPMVLIGIPESRPHLFNHSELKSRLYKEIDFSPIKVEAIEMLSVFATFCGQLALKIVEHQLFGEVPDFLSGDIPACLHEVSGGRIGEVAAFVSAACEYAAAERAQTVTVKHLSAAADGWAIPLGRATSNPFRNYGLVQ
jgi:hypothetical protein